MNKYKQTHRSQQILYTTNLNNTMATLNLEKNLATIVYNQNREDYKITYSSLELTRRKRDPRFR